MKDHRFIELLNLYIDRQITAEETAELEAEIQQHPKRQAVYRQYCQIHTATKAVYQSFRTGTDDTDAAPRGRPASVELFENRRRRPNWAAYAGGLTVAACLALAFVRYNANQGLESTTLASNARPTPVASMETVAVAPVPVAVAAPTAPAQPAYVNLRNGTTNSEYSAMLAALREQDEQRELASGNRWSTSRTQSLFDDNMFDTKRDQSAADQRPLRARMTPSQQAEFTAFQFQR